MRKTAKKIWPKWQNFAQSGRTVVDGLLLSPFSFREPVAEEVEAVAANDFRRLDREVLAHGVLQGHVGIQLEMPRHSSF
jgi:hypothetical protein